MRVMVRNWIWFSLIFISMCFGTWVVSKRNDTLVPVRSPAQFAPPLPVNREEIQLAASRGQDAALAARKTDDPRGAYWNYPLYMGPSYVAQYFLLLNWFKRDYPKLDISFFDTARLKKILFENFKVDSSRKNEGYWLQVKDPFLEQLKGRDPFADHADAQLDVTIINYWTLKVLKEDLNSPVMVQARNFINRMGGVENSTLFVKVMLALFEQYSWGNTFEMPAVLVSNKATLSKFAQWIRPHLLPIAYLREHRVRKNLGPDFSLKEIGGQTIGRDGELIKKGYQFEISKPFLFFDHYAPWAIYLKQKVFYDWLKLDTLIVEEQLKTQQPLGSWGGYTSANLFTLAVFDHFNMFRETKFLDKNWNKIKKAYLFIKKYYLENGMSDYLGTVCDGRFWDTILVHRGLVDSEISTQKLSKKSLELSADYLIRNQIQFGLKAGGIPFGLEFEYAPDVDDTAELVSALGGTDDKKFRQPIRNGIKWILSMQNDDGGWGAFDRNNVSDPLLETVTYQFKDSADLFDDSSEDVTGHVLEAFGKGKVFGDFVLDPENHPKLKGKHIKVLKDKNTISLSVPRAVDYLLMTQHTKGPWFGRWGVNYIYGTSAAVTGLMAIKERVSYDQKIKITESVEKALFWLESGIQNEDGGFGESVRSYAVNDDDNLFESYMGRGVSTPSQTAWALIALIEGGRAESLTVQKALAYLVHSQKFDKAIQQWAWTDPAVVGTGHPSIVYLEYPSYPVAFPLIAIGEYLKRTQK